MPLLRLPRGSCLLHRRPASSSSKYTPAAAAIGTADGNRLVDFVSQAADDLVVLTGAGISTEAGIPDYRSPNGSYSKGHKPMQHVEFVKKEQARARFWARSLVGWRYFDRITPAAIHYRLAELEANGHLKGIITQNVDRLHSRAGSKRVTELHGRGDRVRCLECDHEQDRRPYQELLEARNREWLSVHMVSRPDSTDIRADGDAHLTVDSFRDFHVPGCPHCEGVLMPTFTFFGGNLPSQVKQEAAALVEGASGLMLLGSSCQVLSAFRLVRAAAEVGTPVCIVNIGETRADPLVPDSLRFGVQCGEALELITSRLIEKL